MNCNQSNTLPACLNLNSLSIYLSVCLSVSECLSLLCLLFYLHLPLCPLFYPPSPSLTLSLSPSHSLNLFLSRSRSLHHLRLASPHSRFTTLSLYRSLSISFYLLHYLRVSPSGSTSLTLSALPVSLTAVPGTPCVFLRSSLWERRDCVP